MKYSEVAESEKYGFFLKKVKESNSIWLLQAMEGMFAMIEDDKGQEYIPVWLEKDTALMHIKGEWKEYKAEEMNLNEMLGWLDELNRDQIMIALSGEDENKIIPVHPEHLKTHLNNYQ